MSTIMDEFVEFVQDLPQKYLRKVLDSYGGLTVFSACWAAAVVTLLVAWIIQRRYRHQQFRRWGIPGPPVDSMIFGHYMTLQNDLIGTKRKWSEKYGPVFGYYLGDSPYVNLSDAEIVKQVFVKQVSVFNERPPFPLTVYPVSQTLLCLAHNRWKKVRSVLTPAFSAAKLKFMMKLMNHSASSLVEVLSKHADTGEAVCFSDLSQKVTLDVIARCALATKINCLHNDKDKLLQEMRNFLENSESWVFHLAVGVPAIDRLLLMIARFTRPNRMMAGLVNNIRNVMNSRKEGGLRMEDMIQLLMDAANSGAGEISDEEVAANAFLFLIAGYETSAITMTMATYLLALHAEEQEKLFEEISNVWDTDEELKYDHISQLKRTEVFLLETLRLYPPVISIVSRVGNHEVHVGGFTIPRGVTVQASVMDIHMDERFWPNAGTFQPERFLDTNASSQPYFLPFGVGPKMCIGKRFALQELKITLAYLLKSYRLRLASPSQPMPVRKMVNVSLRPVGKVPLIVERRQ